MPPLRAIQENQTAARRVMEKLDDAWQSAQPYAKKAVHYGFIPAIIALGMLTTEPRPSLAQVFICLYCSTCI